LKIKKTTFFVIMTLLPLHFWLPGNKESGAFSRQGTAHSPGRFCKPAAKEKDKRKN